MRDTVGLPSHICNGNYDEGWLSQCNRLCSSLRRMADLDELLESWGPEGRQKAVEYLNPLYGNIQQLLWALKAIDVKSLAPE
jgi:hypothetical protein